MAAGPDHFHHVRDFPFFEMPLGLGVDLAKWFEGNPHVHVGAGATGIPLPMIPGVHFQITKFMVLQVVAAALTLLIFRGLAKRVQTGEPTQGRFWNFWEAIALFVRDEVVRPTIGDGHHGHDDDHGKHNDHGSATHTGHYADQFLPFILSCFFYILFCNLLGAIPMLGSPTGSICVTGVLAVSAFAFNLFQGVQHLGGLGNFLSNFWLELGLEGAMKFVIGVLIWVIEVFGLLVKHGVLAVRLFANIMGGHTVVGVILGFIAYEGIAGEPMQLLVAPASVLGQVLIGLLELFVSFLQAYVFAYLTTIFLSSCIHKH